jgi:hypothetical protein
MKKMFIISMILSAILFITNCSKKNSPTAPAFDINATATVQAAATATANIEITLTYVSTAGATAQAVATQTAEIQQTATSVIQAQATANAQFTATAVYIAVHGTATPTANGTATVEAERVAQAAATATAHVEITLTYIASAGTSAQAAATQTKTAEKAAATATAAAQQTAKAQVTAIIVTPSITLTPTNTLIPTLTPTATPEGIPPATPLYIYANIYHYDYDSGSEAYCYVNVRDKNSIDVTNARVTVKNVTKAVQFNVPYINTDETYNLDPINDGGAPGDNYEVDVYAGGVTYTAQAALPGNTQLDPDGNIFSWQYSTNGYFDIYDPSGNNIYSKSLSGNSADISSAYPASGVYGVYNINLSLYNNSSFTGGVLNYNYLNVDYNTEWDVEVILDSKFINAIPTPVAATVALTIQASIVFYDLDGGSYIDNMVQISDKDGVTVTNAGVTIKNITHVSQANVPYNTSRGGYYKTSSEINYNHGDIYEVDVCYQGITYTARAAAPIASVSLSSDCDTLSWQSDGNYNWIRVEPSSSGLSIYKNNVSGNSFDISSAYTMAGDYSVILGLANVYGNNPAGSNYPYRIGTFTGTSFNSIMAVGYETGWDVEVTQ